MTKIHSSYNPIEVEFRDVSDNHGFTDINTEKEITVKKPVLRIVVAALQNKARTIIGNRTSAAELVTRALTFCKKLGNISFLKKWFLDVPKLCDMLIDTINGVYKNIPYSSLVMVVTAIIYTVSPVDILCDTIPVLGVLDDAALLNIVLKTIKNDLESYTTWKESNDGVA